MSYRRRFVPWNPHTESFPGYTVTVPYALHAEKTVQLHDDFEQHLCQQKMTIHGSHDNSVLYLKTIRFGLLKIAQRQHERARAYMEAVNQRQVRRVGDSVKARMGSCGNDCTSASAMTKRRCTTHVGSKHIQ